MEKVPDVIAQSLVSLYGVAALILFCFGVYWVFNKKAKQRHLAELRANLDRLGPSDPEYNQVRALYNSLILDAYRWEFFQSWQSGKGGISNDENSGSDSDSSSSSGAGSQGG